MKIKRQNIFFILLATVAILLGVYILFMHETNPLEVNVSHVDVDLDVRRFDQDLFDYDGNLEAHVRELEKEYPRFFWLFTEQIINIGNTGDKDFTKFLDAFMQDYSVEQARNAVNEEFNEISDVESTLESGFKHYKYYFPEEDVPDVITFIAGFNHSVVTDEGLIGVGLDKYLGTDCELYSMMNVPAYAARKMRREMIPVDCMKAWAQMEFPNQDTTDYLVFEMIHQGKLLYFLDAMYPQMPDSLKIGYTTKNMAYCRRFEQDMWQYLVSEELLFSTDYLKQRKIIGEAPFTAAFGKESPGRAGAWLGWQIVRAYMKAENVSIADLMSESDYQKILNQSKYKPKVR
ncbi:MAG TPA: hypothetical protein VJ946_07515 [Bacteroidales bacterium]|nr:hypothetical protein [Bacteroidales bacterium]